MNIEAYFKITYGLYIVSTAYENKLNGYISNTVFQVTAEPARFAIACSKQNVTCDMIGKSGIFSISVLQKDTRAELIGKFGYRSGKDIDKFSGTNYIRGKTGAPILMEDTLAWFECSVIQEIDTGTHILFIGNVVDEDVINPEGEPLTYEHYRNVRKGKAPKNSPTYIDPQKLLKKVQEGDKYYCTACGYIYDPAVGDPENGILPNTRFEDLPENWICPVCGTEKEYFEKIT